MRRRDSGQNSTSRRTQSRLSSRLATSTLSAGGIARVNGVVEIRNSIVAGNTATSSPNVNTITSLGNNLYGAVICFPGVCAAGDITNANPMLGPLAYNDGDQPALTLTHALMPGSPAIDAASTAEVPPHDQRLVTRPIDGDNDGDARADIGAFEIAPGTTAHVADLNDSGTVNAADLAILLGAWSVPAGAPGCGGALPCPADVNADEFVNAADLAILLGAWTT